MIRTILLADDSVTIQKVVELTFMDQDYQVVSVGDGGSALAQLASVNPDLVIADVHMPGIDGYQVCEGVKAVRPDLPVLLLVGTFEPFDEGQARRVGANAFLKKPFDSQELMRQVDDLVRKAAPVVEAPVIEPPAPEPFAFATPAPEPFAFATPAPEPFAFAAPAPEPFAFAAPAPEPFAFAAPAPEPFAFATPAPEPIAFATPAPEPIAFATPAPESIAFATPAPESIAFAAPEPEPAVTISAAPAPEPLPVRPSVAETRPTYVRHLEPGPGFGTNGSQLSDSDIEKIARRVVELIGKQSIQEVAWEVVPDLAEVVIRERLRELESQVE